MRDGARKSIGTGVSAADYERGYADGIAEADRQFQAIMSRATLEIKPRPRRFACRVCGQRFDTGKQLGWHVSHVHPKKKRKVLRAKCRICGQTFKNAITVRHHMNREHA